jgi:hypothetical protein
MVSPPDLQRRYEADPAATVNYEFKVVVPQDASTQSAQFKASVRDVLSPDDTRVEGQTVAINVTPNPVVVKEGGRKMPWWIWAAAAVVVLGVGLGIYLGVRPKGVPSVVGMIQEDASAKLQSVGFASVSVQDTVDENAGEINTVVRQEPEAKSKLPTGNKKGKMPATIVVNRQKDAGTRALEHITQAITALGTPSAAWQGILSQLDDRLRQDKEANLASEVSQIAAKGTATGGTEIRCSADFIRQRMKEDLQRISARLKNQPVPPLEPAFCQVSHSSVTMEQLPGQIEYYGYDLNAPDAAAQVLLRYEGGQMPLATSSPAHYLMILNPGAAGLCNKEDRRIVLRLKSGDHGAVPVTKRQCPPAPPPPKPAASRHLYDDTDELAGGVTGVSEDREYGTTASGNYVRELCRVTRVAGQGSCYSEGNNPRPPYTKLGWVDESDPRNGRCRVHYGMGPFQGVKCRIEIFEVGVQLPGDPPPPCPCW